MKAQEQKTWSIRIDNEIIDFYFFDIAYEVARILKCEHTIQYNYGK